LSSYLPLFVLIGVRSIGRSTGILILCAGLSVSAVIGTLVFLLTSRRRSTVHLEVTAVEDRDADVASYMATYLLPFVTVFSGKWQDVVSLGGFIVVLGLVYVRSRLIYINPTFTLLGYHVAKILPATPGTAYQDRVRWPRFVLSQRARINEGDRIEVHEVTPDLLLLASSDSDG
jgi:hypothetical protein